MGNGGRVAFWLVALFSNMMRNGHITVVAIDWNGTEMNTQDKSRLWAG